MSYIVTGPDKSVIEHVTLHILLPSCHSISEKVIIKVVLSIDGETSFPHISNSTTYPIDING